VFLARGPAEPVDHHLAGFYAKLREAIAAAALREGRWQLLEPAGWPDNPTFQNVVAWAWEQGDERRVVVVNLSETRSQARVPFPWPEASGRLLRLADAFTGDTYERDGGETVAPGLFVDLPAWGFHLLAIERA
jgi:hypothetical protein